MFLLISSFWYFLDDKNWVHFKIRSLESFKQQLENVHGFKLPTLPRVDVKSLLTMSLGRFRLFRGMLTCTLQRRLDTFEEFFILFTQVHSLLSFYILLGEKFKNLLTRTQIIFHPFLNTYRYNLFCIQGNECMYPRFGLPILRQLHTKEWMLKRLPLNRVVMKNRKLVVQS